MTDQYKLFEKGIKMDPKKLADEAILKVFSWMETPQNGVFYLNITSGHKLEIAKLSEKKFLFNVYDKTGAQTLSWASWFSSSYSQGALRSTIYYLHGLRREALRPF